MSVLGLNFAQSVVRGAAIWLLLLGSGSLAFGAESAEPAGERNGPFADLHRDVSLNWKTPLGRGQATAPRAHESLAPKFSRLRGVLLIPDRQEVVFVGEQVRGYAVLDPDDLFDALTLALRNGGGRPPGMSIDPRPEQLNGLKDGDLMDFVYFGGLEQTAFGLAAAESDRRMKTLSLGKDNENPKRAYRVDVKGHKTEIELSLNETGAARPWSRFWIEQAEGGVTLSSDGLAIVSNAKLCVKTQVMVPGKGRLEPAGVDPAPSSAAFSKQLTDRYHEYAREYPEFHRLEAFCQLVNVAEAIRRRESSNPQLAGSLSAIFLDHEVGQVPTPKTTPALKVTSPVDPETGQYVEVTGGVTLEPKLTQVLPANAFTDKLQADVLAARQGRLQWTAVSGGKTFYAAATHRRRRLQAQQEELRDGALAIVREYTAGGSTGDFGRGWKLQTPRVGFSSQLARYEGFEGQVPAAAWYEDEAGRKALTGFTTFALPGKEPTPTFVSGDNKSLLCCYGNIFIYVDGDIGFTEDGQIGSMPPGARLAQFSVSDSARPLEAKHAVTSRTTGEQTVHYRHENDRLVEQTDDQGNWLRLTYAGDRCVSAKNSKGNVAEYRYDDQGNLQYVHNGQGQAIDYRYGEQSGRLIGIQADFQEAVPAAALTTQLALIPASPAAPKTPNDKTLYLEIASTAGETGFELRYQGQPQGPSMRLFGQRLLADEAVAQFSQSPLAKNRKSIVLTGRPEIANRLKPALERALPGTTVFQADQLATAETNLSRQAPAKPHVTLLIFKDGLEVFDEMQPVIDRAVKAGVSVIVQGPEGVQRFGPAQKPGPLVIVAHNEAGLARGLDNLTQSTDIFRDSEIIGAMCKFSDLGDQISHWLQQAGASSVTGFIEPIEQQLLAPLTNELLRALTTGECEGCSRPGQQRRDYSNGRVLDRVLERLQKAPRPPGVSEERIEKHRGQIFEKVGEHRCRAGGKPREREGEASLAA